MLKRSITTCLVPACLAALGSSVASGQNFPSKPLRILTANVGGMSDMATRLIGQHLTALVGQQVITDNRGIVGIEMLPRSQPDGHTLLLYGSTVWISPLLRNAPWDPIKDFSAVTLAIMSPNVLVVHPSLPVGSTKELIALAKKRPGELNYASAATGSTIHLSSELFKAMAGVDIVRIAYKGTGQALNDLLAGEVQAMFPNAGSVVPHIKSGRLRALAVTSAQPSALLPGLPTVAAAGVPGYESETLTGMFAPAGTPANIINRLNRDVVQVLNRTDVKERFLQAGVEIVGSSPQEFAAKVKSEIAKWEKVIKSAGIREE